MKFLALLVLMAFTPVATMADENSGPKLTDEQTEALINRALAESAAEDDDCDDERLLACMGIEQKSCKSLRASMIRECTMPMARKIISSNSDMTQDLEFEHTKCTLTLSERELNIDARRYVECMPKGTYEHSDLINEWLNNR